VHRFLQRFWRNAIDEETGAIRVSDAPADEETRRILHRTIDAVRTDMAKLQFNTAIARLFELNNRLTAVVGESGTAPVEVVSAMTLMLAPLAPHLAEEVWAGLGHPETLAYEPFPEPDPAYLVEEEVEIVVQVDGRVRARVKVPAGAGEADHEAVARADDKVAQLLEGVEVLKVIVVSGRLVNFVTR
jgi:leucyl-tRNA synthetase